MNGYRSDECNQIREVWAANLEEEFERIRDVVEQFQYIAMDTEFPGVVARPTGNVTEYNYQTVKCNVDLLKVIQLGITFADARGNLARGTCTWQFNFRFDLGCDMYAQDSIDFLKQSGIDFEKQQKEGIDLQDFGEIIMSSGLVMNEDVKWISFHGCYDFGYLLKLLTCAPLPDSEAQFFELLHDFFPALYDIKYLLRNIRGFNLNGRSSLQKIAEHLNVERIGQQHQAGSDSLVTCRTFFKLMEFYFDNQIDDALFSGVIYGLGAGSVPKHIRGGEVPEGVAGGGGCPPLQQQHSGGAAVAAASANSQVSGSTASSGGGVGVMLGGSIGGGPTPHPVAGSGLSGPGGGGLVGYGAHLASQQQLGANSGANDIVDPNGLRKLLGHLQQPTQSHKLLAQPQQQPLPSSRPPPLGPMQQQQPPHTMLFNGFEGGAAGGGGTQVGMVTGNAGGVVVAPPSPAGIVGSPAIPGHSTGTTYHQSPSQTSPPLSHLQQQTVQSGAGAPGGQCGGGSVMSPYLPQHHLPLAHTGAGVGCPSEVPGGVGAAASSAPSTASGAGGGTGNGQGVASGVVVGGPGGGGGGAGLHLGASAVKAPVLGSATGGVGGPPPVAQTAGPLPVVNSSGLSPARQQPHGHHHHPPPPQQQLPSPPQVLPHLHFAPIGAGTLKPQDQQQQVLGAVGPPAGSAGTPDATAEGRGGLPPPLAQQQIPWGPPPQGCGGTGLVHGAWGAAGGSIPPPQRPHQQFSASSYESTWSPATGAGGSEGT